MKNIKNPWKWALWPGGEKRSI